METVKLNRFERDVVAMTFEEIEPYVRMQYAAGQKAAREFIAGECKAPQLIKFSPCFAAGFEAVMDEQDGSARTNYTLVSQLAQTRELWHRLTPLATPVGISAEAVAEGDALSTEAGKASMRPQVGHYASDDFEEALAIIEKYGRFGNAGFEPYFVHSVDALASSYAERAHVRMDDARATVQDTIKEMCANRDTRKSIDLRFEEIDFRAIVSEDDAREHLLVPQWVLAPTPLSSNAWLQRGVAYQLVFYAPETVSLGRDGRWRTSWYDVEGYLGVGAEYKDRPSAMAAFRELLAAVRKVRQASSEAADTSAEARYEDDPVRWAGLDEPVKPRVAKVQTFAI